MGDWRPAGSEMLETTHLHNTCSPEGYTPLPPHPPPSPSLTATQGCAAAPAKYDSARACRYMLQHGQHMQQRELHDQRLFQDVYLAQYYSPGPNGDPSLALDYAGFFFQTFDNRDTCWQQRLPSKQVGAAAEPGMLHGAVCVGSYQAPPCCSGLERCPEVDGLCQGPQELRLSKRAGHACSGRRQWQGLGALSAEGCCEVRIWYRHYLRLLHQHRRSQPMDAATHLHPFTTWVRLQSSSWPLYRRISA